MIKKINIIGTGNVASNIALHLFGKVEICSIYSRKIGNANVLAEKINSRGVNKIDQLSKGVDLNIVAINDDGIMSLIKLLPKNIPIVHTSGSVGMNVFEGVKDYGILYPLQTFSKDSPINIAEIPFLLESNSKVFESRLIDFCVKCMSLNYHVTDSELRSEIHLAAVISNNFMTVLLSESENILKGKGLNLRLLKPLLEETLRKSFDVGPKLAQTGPAKRGDVKVLKAQVEKIANPKLKEIYRLMSELISDRSINS